MYLMIYKTVKVALLTGWAAIIRLIFGFYASIFANLAFFKEAGKGNEYERRERVN